MLTSVLFQVSWHVFVIWLCNVSVCAGVATKAMDKYEIYLIQYLEGTHVVQSIVAIERGEVANIFYFDRIFQWLLIFEYQEQSVRLTSILDR